MTQVELVTSIGDTLTRLDTTLMTPTLQSQPARWQQMYAMRTHLDDQQRQLVKVVLSADDASFQILTATIAAATQLLHQQIAAMKQVDAIINTVAQISADLDQILKLV